MQSATGGNAPGKTLQPLLPCLEKLSCITTNPNRRQRPREPAGSRSLLTCYYTLNGVELLIKMESLLGYDLLMQGI